MDSAFPDAQTLEHTLPTPPFNLPDKDDVYVVETAIRSGADYIVTFNLKDFPKDELRKFGIKAIHPDDFVLQLLDEFPDVVLRAFSGQVSMLKNPEKTADEVLVALNRCGLPKTEQQLRYLMRISTVT